MWSTTRQLLHSAPPTDLHDVDCKEMANSFSSYFVDKIADIRKQIRSALKSVENGVSVSTRSRTFTGTLLSAFDVVTVDEVIKLINSLPNKSPSLDALPTSLLKSSCDIFEPAIAHLVNLSISSETFLTSFKMAQVLPLLKKQGLNRLQPSNYRPISNLNTISKIIERLVLGRLKKHVHASGNYNQLQ